MNTHLPTLGTADVRLRFLRFFEERGHTVVRSSSLVPAGDPTLLFTNAGMNQFKDVFLGRERRDYRRAVSTQKCLRAGGKHNDLEVVGFTGRHHTFFEMLGNFSFGDYFKTEAITFAWQFLTEDLGLPPERLWVSVFREDDEAERIWLEEIGVAPERVVRLGEKDNFWQMGETGPCGPCSEIHYDQSDKVQCEMEKCAGIECECDRIVEIWNLVFMQFDRDESGVMHPLPAPSIDTGMGLERLAAVLQGKTSNYEIDLFREIIATIENLTGKAYDSASSDDRMSMRVIADHSRAASFLVADGVLPASDGRGYVLRRIMRRAIRHGKRLGLEDLFLGRVCSIVIDAMGDAYPELVEQQSLVLKVAEQEEVAFRRTLDRGLRLLDDALRGFSPGDVLSGEVVFKLYDTYGFPLDLTQVICGERGCSVDSEGFERCLRRQRESSAWRGSGAEVVGKAYETLADEHGESLFVGHETLESQAKVLALLRDGEPVQRADKGRVEVVLDRTPFYAESGGQVGDAGLLVDGPLRMKVTATKKNAGLHVHVAELEEGEVFSGQRLTAIVDAERRRAIEANHSATHILHKALRDVLGDHVKQAGSLVSPDLLRFDYTTFEPPSIGELEEVERRVNASIVVNEPTSVDLLSFDEARRRGAIAIFGEKYAESVRTVGVGGESLELCGGTHVERSGDIGLFRIMSDSAVASGVRRIVARTGQAALRQCQEEARLLREIAGVLKVSPKEAGQKAEQMQLRLRELEKEIDALEKRLATSRSSDVMEGVREVAGVKVLTVRSEVGDPKTLRDLADRLRDRLGEGVVALGAERDGKAVLLVAVTKGLVARVRASDIVKEIAPIVSGRGGGKPDMAQAGGDAPESLDAALARVYEIIPPG